jgi:hypothetical protein
MIIGSAVFSLPAAILASADSFLGKILMLFGSVITITIFTWSLMNLAPSGNRLIGWVVFAHLLVHFFYSKLLLFEGKNIFGDPLPGPVGVFWGIQNVVWLATCFVTVYFSKQPGGAGETADI